MPLGALNFVLRTWGTAPAPTIQPGHPFWSTSPLCGASMSSRGSVSGGASIGGADTLEPIEVCGRRVREIRTHGLKGGGGQTRVSSTGHHSTMTLTRSEQMSRIRGRDTEPELVVRRELWAKGIRFRRHFRTPGGRADLVIPRAQFALFIDGCFWHGCPEHYVRPRTRNDFWDAKLAENVARDRRQTRRLEQEGWTVLRVWEHEVREDPNGVVDRIQRALERRPPRTRSWRVTRVDVLDPATDLERRQLVDLRDETVVKAEERIRSTKKVGRVRSAPTRG